MDKNLIDKLMNETVSDIISRMEPLNEMAVPMKAYKKRVDGLRFQLAENWCLCRWCDRFDPANTGFPHWICELKACIDNLKFLDIKNGINKRRLLKRMLVDDYDYNDFKMIERIVRGKFSDEGMTNPERRCSVCVDFSKGINKLIDVISDDSIDTQEYIRETFSIGN